jgi:hypothetical protein
VKNAEAFAASVYARAAQRRRMLLERRQRLRRLGAGGAALAVVLVAAAAARSPQLLRLAYGDDTTTTLPAHTVQTYVSETLRAGVEEEGAAIALADTRLLLRQGKNAGAVKKVALNNRADEFAALAEYKQEADLKDADNLAIVPIPGQTETVNSREDVEEYLEKQGLKDAFAEALAEYDEIFFASHALILSAIEVFDPLAQSEPANAATPGTQQPEETEVPLLSLPDATETVRQTQLSGAANLSSASTASQESSMNAAAPSVPVEAEVAGLLLVSIEK